MLPVLAATADTYGPHPWAGPFFWVFPLLWFLLLLLVIGLLARRWRRSGGPGWSAAASGESVLSERFARGDIDEQEYRARLEVLRASRQDGRR